MFPNVAEFWNPDGSLIPFALCPCLLNRSYTEALRGFGEAATSCLQTAGVEGGPHVLCCSHKASAFQSGTLRCPGVNAPQGHGGGGWGGLSWSQTGPGMLTVGLAP